MRKRWRAPPPTAGMQATLAPPTGAQPWPRPQPGRRCVLPMACKEAKESSTRRHLPEVQAVKCCVSQTTRKEADH